MTVEIINFNDKIKELKKLRDKYEDFVSTCISNMQYDLAIMWIVKLEVIQKEITIYGDLIK